MIKDIKGAIFDVDGTLLDSMPAWEMVPGKYLQAQGITPPADLNKTLASVGGHEIPAYFRNEFKLKETEQKISDGIFRLLESLYRQNAELKEGVNSVLEGMARRGIKMCVATASDRRLIEPTLERLGINRYFERIFTCGEERTSKNKPDIFYTAAAFMNSAPKHTFVFEDALYAVRTAKAAGFRVAAVYDAAADGEQTEIRSLADIYIKTLKDFKF